MSLDFWSGVVVFLIRHHHVTFKSSVNSKGMWLGAEEGCAAGVFGDSNGFCACLPPDQLASESYERLEIK